MRAGYTGFDKRLKYLFDNATEVSFTQSLATGTPIGTLSIDSSSITLYAPAGGGGSSVSITPLVNSGTKIAILTIDGVGHDIYAPIYVGYGTTEPSGGNDKDFYVQIADTQTTGDIFGTPTSNSGANYSITSDHTIYSTYDAYKGFGTGEGWGAESYNDNYLQYSRTDNTFFKITQLTLCNYFTVNGGWLVADEVVIKGSNDGTNWTDIYTIDDCGTQDVERTFQISHDGFYQMIRFQCDSVSGYSGLKGIVATGQIKSSNIVKYWVNKNGLWIGSPNYATAADIATLQANFQAGVDAIYNACVTKGSTPASHSLSDVVDGILAIPTGGGSLDPRDAIQVIPRLSSSDTSRVWSDSDWSSGYAAWQSCDGSDYDYWLSEANYQPEHYVVFTLTQAVIPLFIRWLGSNDGDCVAPLSVKIYDYANDNLLGSFTPTNKYDDVWPIFLYSSTAVSRIKVVFEMDDTLYGAAGMSDVKLWGIPVV